MSTLEELNLAARPVSDKDWKILWPWFNLHGWGAGNKAVLELGEKMSNCRFLVAVDKNDQPISYICFSIHPKYVYIAGYITDPELRGKGFGSALFRHVMQLFDPDRNFLIKSRGVMTEKYCRISKFYFKSPIANLRYVGSFSSTFWINFVDPSEIEMTDEMNELVKRDIVGYDTSIHGQDLSPFFNLFLKLDKSQVRTIRAVDIHGITVGYGSIINCNVGRQVGPLISDSFDSFISILHRLVDEDFVQKHTKYEQITFNVPSNNLNAINFLLKANFEMVRSLDRSFTKKVEDVDFTKIYSFANHIGLPE